jgi:tetratricopeptide (TPR) repeat protein
VKVFLSHCSLDKSRIEEFATQLRTVHGIDVWYDKWEIAKGDDVVEKMNEGLQQCEAALIVFSHQTDNLSNGPWAAQERSALIYARVKDKKRIIPILLDDNAQRPPLLQSLAFAKIHEIEAIAAALKGERPAKPALGQPSAAPVHRITVALREQPHGQLTVAVQINQSSFTGPPLAQIPPAIQAGLQRFQEGLPHQLVRQTAHDGRVAMEGWLAQLGRDLGQLCLPGAAGAELQTVVKASPLGTRFDVVFEADRPEWLGLPFETLRLPDDTRLALHPGVASWRRLTAAPSARPTQITALAHPLKVLVAVGAPDEDQTKAAVLDHERELQVILDAVEPVQQHDNCEVRILEVGHPDEIAKALKDDPYHALHLSCHGQQGELLLETELGAEYRVTADQFIESLRQAQREIPLVFLNACHTGVASPQSAGFALELLRAGVPAVVATLAPISDAYATQLAGAFYRHLSKTETARPAQALAAARQEVEHQRQKLLSTGRAEEAGFPEYGTATLFLAGDDRPLVNGDADRVGLKTRSITMLQGELPALQRGDLIGRRHELRTALQVLRAERGLPGVLLRGIGGLGKSALAGRIAMAQLEQKWTLAVHRGKFDLGSVVHEVGKALKKSASTDQAQQLLNPQLDDDSRLKVLRRLFQAEPVLLILDDFEQNLAAGGQELTSPEVHTVLTMLLQGPVRGRVLVTCRYGLRGVRGCEGFGRLLADVPLRSLSDAEVRKLVQRLPGLRGQDPSLLKRVLREIGGHPRMLEFLNALRLGLDDSADPAAEGAYRLGLVSQKMFDLAQDLAVDLEQAHPSLDEQMELTLRLGQRDIVLEELVKLAQQAGDAEVLFQAAVSNLAVTVADVAGMSQRSPQGIASHWKRLEKLSLLTAKTHDTALVPRWTAQGLQKLQPEADYRTRCVRAGDYRLAQIQNRAASPDHFYEVYRNYFAGAAIDRGAGFAMAVAEAFDESGQTIAMLAVANEALQSVPSDHQAFANLADFEAQAYLRLGDTQRAKQRYLDLLEQHTARATANPDRADYQHNLSVSYNKMGDLYSALGDGPAARDACAKSLDIRLKLAQAEPNRADYQRDLSVSYNKMGDLYSDLGDGPAARDAFAKSLDIALTLAQAEPNRADYHRGLYVSYIKMGDLYRALGDGPAARDAFAKSLDIALTLAKAEPDRADYQHDLAALYERIGDSDREQQNHQSAHQAFSEALKIRHLLATAEPERADYQVELVMPLIRLANYSEDPKPLVAIALQILEQLDQTGRLSPADRPKLDAVRQIMQQLEAQPG